MFIVMMASECAPVAKVGGLGDVVFGLSHELAIRGNDVEIILPKYDCMRYDHIYGLCVAYNDLWVPWCDTAIHCTVWFGFVHGRKCFFIEPHSVDNFFSRGGFYGYPDEALRFAFFSKACLEFLHKTNKRPDIIHTHDWQTALVPVLLYEMFQAHGMDRQRVCHTIHNFKHQGIAGANILSATGLHRPDYYLQHDRLLDNFDHTALNFTKGAILYANFITTVSPHYAWEVSCAEQGFGLEHTLHTHHHKFGGVLNGIDYGIWNAEIDPLIPYQYAAYDLAGKYRNKEALRNRLMLEKNFKPIIAYVGRLDSQKGVHLIRHSIYYALHNNAQFVLLGSSPEASISEQFWQLKHALNDNPNCHLEIGFDEELSHLIYAGSDMIIVPSIFEPCGLTQMIGLKYGTVPIVRAAGGLRDTVFDRDYATNPEQTPNGYVFYDANYFAIESALERAIGLWTHYPEEFRQMINNGMQYDYSWNHSGQDYVNIYEYIRHP